MSNDQKQLENEFLRTGDFKLAQKIMEEKVFMDGKWVYADDSLLDKIKEHKEKALRYNQGKLKWSLVHFKSLEPMVKVLMYGCNKYSAHNWKKGLDKQEILDSMQRHLAALIDGQEIDPESQEHHIGHIMCNCLFYSYFNIVGGELSSG